MTRKIMYAIYDHATKQHNVPAFVATEAEAKRMVATALREDSLLSNHPEDYSLIYIGSYDTETGQITSDEHDTILTGQHMRELRDHMRNDR